MLDKRDVDSFFFRCDFEEGGSFPSLLGVEVYGIVFVARPRVAVLPVKQ